MPSKRKNTTANATTNGNGVYEPPTTRSKSNGKSVSPVKKNPTKKMFGAKNQIQVESVVLWRHPVMTIEHFIKYLIEEAKTLLFVTIPKYKISILTSLLFLGTIYIGSITDGPHSENFRKTEKLLMWSGWWLFLGVLSSVGLGSGLHTFVLYLGPHIAKVTLAAQECKSLDFPEPPYPTSIVCPPIEASSSAPQIGLMDIMSKVRWEAFMWGLGTAIGELPPYFIARANRLSSRANSVQHSEEMDELNHLLHADNYSKLSFPDKCKRATYLFIRKVGFWGILLAASIPNPLFDIAGLTCGYFLIPFTTFFIATAIGKAVIKMHIQKLAVIFAFSESHVDHLLDVLKGIPLLTFLGRPLQEYIGRERHKLHNPNEEIPVTWIAFVFSKLVMIMIFGFVVSIVNSLAQSHYREVVESRKKRDHKAV